MEKFTETYQEIKKGVPYNFRASLRNIALAGMSLKDRIGGIQQYLETPRVQFLYIHHSFRDELEGLDKLLKKLSENHTFITYSQAVERILDNNIDKPYISISSDDGFKNNLHASDVLDNYGAKACFFINPGLIGEHSFEKIKGYCKKKLHLPPVEFLDWKDVDRLILKGHEIGSHTMYHDNIVEMSRRKLEQDMHETYEILTSRCGMVKHFAFPYGRFFHFNEQGREAVFNAGFHSCASAERGCHMNTVKPIAYDRLCIRRDHVILDWNMDHIMYFIANNVRKTELRKSHFPYQISG